MTDEEMAEEYADKISGLELTCSLLAAKDKSHAYRLGRYDGFLTGLKAGRTQWHDLRKDKTDLPENKRNVWCDYGDGCGKGYYNEYDDVWWIEGHLYCSTIIAWCKLPQFTDKE